MAMDQAQNNRNGEITESFSKGDERKNLNLLDIQFEKGVGKTPAYDSVETRTKLAQMMNEKIGSAFDSSVSEQDSRTARDMNVAIMNGDTAALTKAVERFLCEPQDLKRFIDSYNKVLDSSGSGLHATVNGEKVIFSGAGSRGLEIATDGTVTVRDVHHLKDGAVIPGEQNYNFRPRDMMGLLSDEARFGVKYADGRKYLHEHHFDPHSAKPL